MPSTIRPATTADLSLIQAIAQAAYAPYITRIGREPAPMLEDYASLIQAGHVQVLSDEEEVVGFIVLFPAQEALLLDNLAVTPGAQGHGYGRQLLDFAEQRALATGHSCIRLYTHETMSENIALYARRGYAETHRAEEEGLRRVYMSKALD
ncbi:GNAT family N-acetyltransferase [Pseudomonas sp. NPDC089530]|uniref:GNAT family N-acetyltransferase n=1 Tax=Pseudomonas sp. NPDC089530 TaxID=3390651 RepID=UPI003D01A492